MDKSLQEFFCNKASNRVNELIKKYQLSYFKIYPGNSSIISWIASGKRTGRNPYLFTETSIEKIVEVIRDYDSSYSGRVLQWGDNEEIAGYIYELMELICGNLTSEQQLILDDTLIDDIYFAETKAYTEILNENNSWLIGVDFEELYSVDVPISQNLAKKELLEDIKDAFLNEFIKFLDESNRIRTKVDGKNNYVDKGITFKNQFRKNNIVKIFLNVVKNHKLPIEESIGYRVYSIVKKDVAKLESLLEKELVYNTVYSSYRKDKILESELKFQYDIIKAGRDYIKSLYDSHRNRNEIINKLKDEGE